MEFIFEYDDNENLNDLIENNSDKFLIKIENLFKGNYATFTDEKPIETFENKISILEEENEKLKQELSITQDAVNELIFNSLNI